MKLRTFPTTAALASALALAGCGNAPRVPYWQIEAKGALDRAVAAYLEGNAKVEQAEQAHTRQQLARTGRADLLAQAELVLCAARVASLAGDGCPGFEALRPDATPAQRAYAEYLRNQLAPADIALLPPSQRATALRVASDASPLPEPLEPLSTLVAAGVLLQAGKANPAIIEQAVNTASAQGWRRPLLAWLGVQRQRAADAGNAIEAARLQRRMDLVLQAGGGR
jgi:hypothetical protein